jgi:putative transposase
MKRLAARQTRYVNRLERRTGSLWEGRYKISPVDTDAYLLACCRYVEMNPVKAAMVAAPEQYRWSSYTSKVRGDWAWLDKDPCLFEPVGATEDCVERYRVFVHDCVCAGESELIKKALQRNQLTGDSRFVSEVERRIGVRVEYRDSGRPKREGV